MFQLTCMIVYICLKNPCGSLISRPLLHLCLSTGARRAWPLLAFPGEPGSGTSEAHLVSRPWYSTSSCGAVCGTSLSPRFLIPCDGVGLTMVSNPPNHAIYPSSTALLLCTTRSSLGIHGRPFESSSSLGWLSWIYAGGLQDWHAMAYPTTHIASNAIRHPSPCNIRSWIAHSLGRFGKTCSPGAMPLR